MINQIIAKAKRLPLDCQREFCLRVLLAWLSKNSVSFTGINVPDTDWNSLKNLRDQQSIAGGRKDMEYLKTIWNSFIGKCRTSKNTTTIEVKLKYIISLGSDIMTNSPPIDNLIANTCMTSKVNSHPISLTDVELEMILKNIEKDSHK